MYAITTKGGTSNYKLIPITENRMFANATVLYPEKKLIQSMAISKIIYCWFIQMASMVICIR